MGVDWHACSRCGDTFCDVGYFVSCEGCGKNWCSDKCAELDGFKDDCCKYCRKEDFKDDVLLKYALELLDLNREELIEKYINIK